MLGNLPLSNSSIDGAFAEFASENHRKPKTCLQHRQDLEAGQRPSSTI